MNSVQQLQADLAKQYKYKPLSKHDSLIYREVYRRTIPDFLNVNGDTKKLYSSFGTLIANGYDRIVIGDYGAFVEFSPEQAIHGAYIVAPGQEYRLTPEYANVKYNWITTRDDSNIKIYHQRHTVTYADYKPGYFYVSVFEVYLYGDELDSTVVKRLNCAGVAT